MTYEPFVSPQYKRLTDRQTDGRADEIACFALHAVARKKCALTKNILQEEQTNVTQIIRLHRTRNR